MEELDAIEDLSLNRSTECANRSFDLRKLRHVALSLTSRR
jgi:hypothetical protein